MKKLTLLKNAVEEWVDSDSESSTRGVNSYSRGISQEMVDPVSPVTSPGRWC